MGTLDSYEVTTYEKDPVRLTMRLRRMLGFLSQLDLRRAEREAKLLPKFVNCSMCGREQRAKEVLRIQGRPRCVACQEARWPEIMKRYEQN